MNMVALIEKKKHGDALDNAEIEYIVRGAADGTIPDYQLAAFLMAVCFTGMSDEETAQFTACMAHSGETVDLSAVNGTKADKHSTGGIGDKTTLIACPLVAAADCGVRVAKLSGRGLGFTGGTIDKLESIPGLRTDLDAVDEGGAAVTLMTVHSAKGLEFDYVFVTGMEETVFPHMNSIGESEGVEEERRLAYVAITRARRKLCLTCAQTRQLFGQTNANPASRFIQEIPSELRDTKGLGSAGFAGSGWEKRGSRRGISGSGREAGRGGVSYQSSASQGTRRGRPLSGVKAGSDGKRAGARTTFKKGDTVDHKTFGKGVVIKVDGDTLLVKFAKTGQVKKLLKDYAPIVKLS